MREAVPPIDVSVLVTTYRRPRHLAIVLESIAMQRAGGAALEVVVADDGSGDTTAQVVRDFAAHAPFPVRFTSQPHDGFRLARVRNEAARLARGGYLLFLDGDCVIPRHHVAAHLTRRRHGTALIGYCARLPEATSRLLVPENLSFTNLADLVPDSERASLVRRHRKAWWHAALRHPTKPRLAGGDFGVWHDDFRRVNGFDERFVGWGQEDDDLGLRLRAAGVRLESILDRTFSLHVWHESDPTATRRWRDGPNVAYFARRGRLTACRHGLVERGVDDVVWGLPDDVDATPLGRRLRRILDTAPLAAPGAACEIDIVIRPGGSRFTRPAECRLVLQAATAPLESDLAAAADQVLPVAEVAQLPEALDAAGSRPRPGAPE
jgi:glycosyltransferase involved in cell wall biosynthesis